MGYMVDKYSVFGEFSIIVPVVAAPVCTLTSRKRNVCSFPTSSLEFVIGCFLLN